MKSIIFNQHQVNHALKNDEGMFRVVIKNPNNCHISYQDGEKGIGAYFTIGGFRAKNGFKKSPFQVGETIFVKEAFISGWAVGGSKYSGEPLNPFGDQTIDILYRATDKEAAGKFARWSPASHMVRHLSRLTLRIKDIRVERLADISEEDAAKEGGVFKSNQYWHSTLHPKKGTYQCWISAKEAFGKLWNSTHKKPEEKFEANPFVFCYSYEVIK